jgi:Ca-activated chloride channel homolog
VETNRYTLERWLAFLLSLLFFLPLVARGEELARLDDTTRPELPSHDDDAHKEVVALGLEYHLVTPLTSLVAVDITPKGIDPATCLSELVPVNLPDGWGGLDADGSLPRTASPALLWLVVGLLLLMGAFVVRAV